MRGGGIHTRIDPLRGRCAERVSSGLRVEEGKVSRGGSGQCQDGDGRAEHLDRIDDVEEEKKISSRALRRLAWTLSFVWIGETRG
jgi:hypothetical protein